MLLLALPAPARGDPPGRPILAFRTFTTADGLAHDIVRDVLERRDGSIWLATMGGVTRYEPDRCRYRSFAPDWSRRQREAMSLARGPDDTVWVATQGGGIAANRRGRWTWYTTRDGLPSDEITSLTVDVRGRVWATPTIGGIAMYDGKTWRTFTTRDGLSSGEIGRCTGLRDGTVLCGTYEQPVLQRFRDGRWSQVRVDAPARRHFYVHAITETRDGQIWLATKGAGAIQGTPDGDRYRWTVHDRHGGLVNNRVGAILQARDGSIWFATAAGVSHYDGKSWESFAVRDGLGANQVFAITETRDGALWFATLGGGASRLAPTGWEQITEAQGLPSDNVTGGLLRSRDGDLWLGTDRGLARLHSGRRSWAVVEPPSGERSVAANHVNHLLQDPTGTIWVATRDGIRALAADGQWSHTAADPSGNAGPIDPVVNRLAVDRQGRLWAATAAGVSRRAASGAWVGFSHRDGLPSDRIHDLALDSQGRVWAATENGVALFTEKRWIAFLSQGPASRTNRIYSLALDARGRLWASGLEGVDFLVPGEAGRWERMLPNRWLPAGIYSRFVMSTPDGSLWFGVRGLGVRRLVGSRWTAYPAADEALPGDTLRDVLQLADRSFLFATLGGGLRRYRPDRQPPQTFIGAASGQAGGGGHGAPATALTGEEVVIPFSGQDVLKHTRTGDLLYSHRVDGGDWSAFSPATRAGLSHLTPGKHRFEVRAMDQDLNVDPTPATHELRVVRPWWAEPYFLGIVGFSLLLVAYAVWRIGRAMARERAAVAQEQTALEQRKRFVRLASHELRKPLTRLAHRAEVLTLPATLEDRERLEEHAEALVRDSGHVSRLVETLLEQARIEEGLRLELRPGDLSAVAGAVLEELEPGGRPALRRGGEELPVCYDPFYLPLAIRNLVENALKYGGDQVELETRRRDGEAILVVRDRGPGIADEDRERIFEPFFRGRTRPEHSGFGLGLGFAREIARAHHGDLTLLAPDGPGAAFCLSLPLSEPDSRESIEEDENGTTADHR